MTREMSAEKDIHQILSAFVDDISTEESLENYWKKNKTAIGTLKQLNKNLYNNLLEQFKAQRKAIQQKPSDIT
tara:strand:- start:96 stop:314 length:219 start_codon:yes stop_codon:yes gene_type:complete